MNHSYYCRYFIDAMKRLPILTKLGKLSQLPIRYVAQGPKGQSWRFFGMFISIARHPRLDYVLKMYTWPMRLHTQKNSIPPNERFYYALQLSFACCSVAVPIKQCEDMDHGRFPHFQHLLKSRKSIKTNFAVFLLTFTAICPSKQAHKTRTGTTWPQTP